MRVLVFMVLTAVANVQSEDHMQIPEGYIVNVSAGKAYKVMYQAQKWERAKDECELSGGYLAVPQSQDEFEFLQKMVRGMYYPHVTGTRYKLLVWLGINNLDEYTVWRNIDGEDINETGFSKWASKHVSHSDSPQEPHCAGIDGVNPGLRDYWCHLRQPYLCQIQVITNDQPDYNNLNEAVEHFLHERIKRNKILVTHTITCLSSSTQDNSKTLLDSFKRISPVTQHITWPTKTSHNGSR